MSYLYNGNNFNGNTHSRCNSCHKQPSCKSFDYFLNGNNLQFGTFTYSVNLAGTIFDGISIPYPRFCEDNCRGGELFLYQNKQCGCNNDHQVY